MYEGRRDRSWRRRNLPNSRGLGLNSSHGRGDVADVLRPVCNGVTVQSTAMRRAFVSALFLSALCVPAFYGTAWAGPLQITPDANAAPPPEQSAVAGQPQQRSAQTQSNLGGGFIE